jgi:hypothetical protein
MRSLIYPRGCPLLPVALLVDAVPSAEAPPVGRVALVIIPTRGSNAGAVAALSSCLLALAEGHAVIPTRDSRLTQLLADVLAPGSPAHVVAHVRGEPDLLPESVTALALVQRLHASRRESLSLAQEVAQAAGVVPGGNAD